MTFNIYGDESCHLEHDLFDKMFLGAIKCDKSKAKFHFQNIREIKKKHGLKTNYEIKWTKVSKCKYYFYNDLIEYFLNNADLSFRCIIATGKKELNNNQYNQTYDDWYYKMYYLLLTKMITVHNNFYVYLDKKDSNGYKKANELGKIISNYLYSFNTLKKIQLVNSHEVELIQLCDFLLGAVSYYNRYSSNMKSQPKRNLCNLIADTFQVHLDMTNYDKKFNIFVWEPRN